MDASTTEPEHSNVEPEQSGVEEAKPNVKPKETRSEMLSRHQKEIKELQGKEIALKKAAAKGSKAEQMARKKSEFRTDSGGTDMDCTPTETDYQPRLLSTERNLPHLALDYSQHIIDPVPLSN